MVRFLFGKPIIGQAAGDKNQNQLTDSKKILDLKRSADDFTHWDGFVDVPLNAHTFFQWS